LSRSRSFPCKRHDYAIECIKNWGPSFGWGDLTVQDEPFNKPNACSSLANKDSFFIPVNSEGINMLTNKESRESEYCYFTITEIEVWGVTFSE
jgi:hypothetical protein